jgi:hypothetical protein
MHKSIPSIVFVILRPKAEEYHSRSAKTGFFASAALRLRMVG